MHLVPNSKCPVSLSQTNDVWASCMFVCNVYMCHLGASTNFVHPNVPVNVNPHYLSPGYLGKDREFDISLVV